MSRNYSREALIEVFGTPNPSSQAVSRWKMSWRDVRGRVRVYSYRDAMAFLNESGVDPLFYQLAADTGSDLSDQAEKYYIVFYKDEHEVFFKLHNGIG